MKYKTAVGLRFFFMVKTGKIKQNSRKRKKPIFQKILLNIETFFFVRAYYLMQQLKRRKTNQKFEKCNLFVMV